MSQILYRYNGMICWPEGWEPHYNACAQPCDMLIGPCVCGVWHRPEYWTAELKRYNAEIRDCPLDVTPDYMI